ncbi:MAG: OsmC family protein [Chloroflexi bacterium]|nr:OsmC family protein [Chloroflexota bacterium]
MEAKLSWKEKMTFVGVADSGHEVRIDTDPGVGGDDTAARPMELIALGLAGCTGMDVISILRKKKQDVTTFDVNVSAERAGEHPKVITSAVITYVLHGQGLDEAALLRAIELSALKYCPAQAMLSKAFPMELRYQIYEGDALVKEGAWQPPAA